MLSILGRFLCDEFGPEKYNVYFEKYSENKDRDKIFRDIYKELGNKDIYTLHEMLERLLCAVELSIRVSRQFIWVFIATVFTISCLLFIKIPFYLIIIKVIFVSSCFLYKSFVYFLNRFSYIDINITLLYKTALYHRIMTCNITRLAGKGEE